jgi:hypothetical protein
MDSFQTQSLQDYHRHCDSVKTIILQNKIVQQVQWLTSSQYESYISNLNQFMSPVEKEDLIKIVSKFKIHSWASWKGRQEYKNKYITLPDNGHEYQIQLYKDYYEKAKDAYHLLTFKHDDQKVATQIAPLVEEEEEEEHENVPLPVIEETNNSFWTECDFKIERKVNANTDKYLQELIKENNKDLSHNLLMQYSMSIRLGNIIGHSLNYTAFKSKLRKFINKLNIPYKLGKKILENVIFITGYCIHSIFATLFEDGNISIEETKILVLQMEKGGFMNGDDFPIENYFEDVQNHVLVIAMNEMFSILQGIRAYAMTTQKSIVARKLVVKLLDYQKEIMTNNSLTVETMYKMIKTLQIISHYIHIPGMKSFHRLINLMKNWDDNLSFILGVNPVIAAVYDARLSNLVKKLKMVRVDTEKKEEPLREEESTLPTNMKHKVPLHFTINF